MPNEKRRRLEILPDNQRTFGPCTCCGQMTTRVWGYVHDLNEALAAYYVEWTPGHQGQQANFDLIVGSWGERSSASDREAVALEFGKLETGPAFLVIDANSRKIAASPLVSRALDRSAVIGTPIAAVVFAICDLIFLEDPRISELRG